MKFEDGWFWPDQETHMNAWIAIPANRMSLNGRPAYQGKKQIAALALCHRFRTAIDVGAHIGTWAFNMAQRFSTVRCFEPMQSHRECFAMNVEAENVVMYPLVLGERSGTVGMFTGPSSTGDTYVRGEGDVRMETLDSFGFEDVDLIKIDCEGYEENVLRGGVETIKRCRPVICVEQKRNFPEKYGQQPQGAVAFLRDIGYVVAQEIGGDYLMTPVEPH